jgi:hypothetical protein
VNLPFAQTSLVKLRMRSAFTALEIAVVLAVLSIAAGISVPMYQRYMARSNIEIARQNIAQGIERAKFLSQVGMNDSKWGFSTDSIPGRGVLFMGESFAERDSAYDEMYAVPESVAITGLTEVVFTKVTGLPSTSGEITLRSQYDDEAVVTVTLGAAGEVDVPQNWLEICINPYTAEQRTIKVPDSIWTQYQKEGAQIGACSEALPNSSSSSSFSSSSSTAAANITIEDGTITTYEDYILDLQVLGTALTISSGYEAPITVRLKINGPFIEPWGDFEKPVDGNVNKDGNFTYTSDTIVGGSTINMWAKSFYKKRSWYDGTENNHFNLKQLVKTPEVGGLVLTLVDGDAVPEIEGAGGQADVEDFLEPYINQGNNTLSLDSNQVIFLFELWTTDVNDASADFQDLVLLATFTSP